MDEKLIGVIVLMMCCIGSSAFSAMSMGGEEPKTPEDTTKAEGPPCVKDKSFTGQTGSFECESLDAFKPESATWWGSWINNSVPISSEEAKTAGQTHTFHELSSSANEKKYIAMRKTSQHCKMVQFDITKEGNKCSYKINNAGYAGYGGGGMGAQEACTATTDAEVLAKWNAKTPVDTARNAATDTGYGLKSLGYSLNC